MPDFFDELFTDGNVLSTRGILPMPFTKDFTFSTLWQGIHGLWIDKSHGVLANKSLMRFQIDGS
jgi:hypothetical protein